MKKIYDVSLTITPQLPVWPKDPQVILERVHKIEEGANANVSRVAMSVHTGTHVDAPYHFLPGGKTIEELPLDVLVGSVQVVELPDSVSMISKKDLEEAGIKPDTTRLLVKTRNSRYWAEKEADFQPNFVGIDLSGSEWLVQKGIRLLGIDYLSVAPYKRSRPTHEALLKANMVILEGVNLTDVPAGEYLLVCLPLKLGGSDGAPARVILIEE